MKHRIPITLYAALLCASPSGPGDVAFCGTPTHSYTPTPERQVGTVSVNSTLTPTPTLPPVTTYQATMYIPRVSPFCGQCHRDLEAARGKINNQVAPLENPIKPVVLPLPNPVRLPQVPNNS